MTTIIDFQERIKNVDLNRLAAQTMRQTEKDFIDWQKEQLFSGKLSTGGKIKPPYRKTTVIIKKKKGQPIDRVTLKDTGWFYDGIILDIGLQTYKVTSEDDKTPFLLTRYTENIFGLNKISTAGYNNDSRPVFLANYRKSLGI
jgi:hypothetical protein